jgi:hypothetical protein
MDDFADALRVEVSEFAVDRYAATDVYSSECWIRNVGFTMLRAGFIDTVDFGTRQDLKFIGRAV